MISDLRAPFPWFGGKRRAAHIVWPRLGADVNNYVEPFAGSLAVLLARPGGPGKIETVNDRDCMIANFWRATTAAPEAVAHHCDWPVNEADVHARHAWLCEQLAPGSAFIEAMHSDPDHFDVKIAGWWVWGICQWIGGGWCAAPERGAQPRQLPHMGNAGRGVHSSRERRPSRKLPHMGNAGTGVHSSRGRQLPQLSEWFAELRDRLRGVRVACGDWSRVLGPGVLTVRPCAVFLDPPYDDALRDRDLYAVDDGAISRHVREWAIEHGEDPALRIALCGYDGEHEMPASWDCVAWKGNKGYATSGDNARKERVWFSPHCLRAEQGSLWPRDVLSSGAATTGGPG